MKSPKNEMRGSAAYQELRQRGALATRVKQAFELLEDCCLCGRRCGAHRLRGEVGECRTGRQAVISSYGPHFGEEAPLVGNNGSGTIFFANCNLRCLFCQNYTISQLGEGLPASKEQLVGMMLALQTQGCHNINLVSPTHVMPQILEALEIASDEGLKLPLVYNTGGYDSAETLELLDGIVDIYMPDMKYSMDSTAEALSGIRDYPAMNRAAVKEMYRQVGDLHLDPPQSSGIAWRGLIVRHLVLPNGMAGTSEVVRFLAEEISPHTYLNIMAQYRPCYQSNRVPEVDRPITRLEYQAAIELARQHGLERLDGIHSSAVLRLICTHD